MESYRLGTHTHDTRLLGAATNVVREMSACSERLTELDYTPIQQNDEPRLIVSVALTSLSWHVCMSGDLFHLHCMISVDVVQRTVDVVDRLAEGDGAAAISPQH